MLHFNPLSDETILPGGDWAGNADVYARSGCPSTCVSAYCDFSEATCGRMTKILTDYVNNHPEAFMEAYWDFKNIRMYGEF